MLMASLRRREIRWEPNAGPQERLFKCPAEIILWGGAKGAGKTDAGILFAAHGIEKAGFKGLILRRKFTELEKHIILRSRELFTGVGKYDARTHRWEFRTKDGGTSYLEFGYLEQEGDVFNYQGAEYARIFFDESTAFSEASVRWMYTCLRSGAEGVQRKMLLGANPIGPGFGWHKEVFIKDREPIKLYRDAKWPSDGKLIGTSTCFIPARVWDNPVLLARDPDYPKRLESQFGPITQALLYGSWEQALYLAFDFDYEIHTVEPFKLPDWVERWVGIDWGKSDIASAVQLAADHERVYAEWDCSRPGKEIKPYAHEVLARCRGRNVKFVVLSHECFADRGMGHTQADQFIEVFSKENIPVIKSDQDPEGRLLLSREMLRTSPIPSPAGHDLEDFEYWAERFRNEGASAGAEYLRLKSKTVEGPLPKLLIFRPDSNGLGCPYLIKSLPLLTVDPKQPYKIAAGQDDHGADALGYGLKAWSGGAERPAEAIYRERYPDLVPDSLMGFEEATRAAQRMEDEEAGILAPFRWGRERFR